ncbi:MAG: MoaD/ThiS family protein [Halioglobus sp.]|nr:MoaD/ThiS family protein [Halioglobus sp.]
MLTVRFFARLRETLDCAALQLPWQEDLTDLRALEALLCERGGETWRQALAEDNVLRAVNQVVVNGNPSLRDGDEVAFFPPVTGG